MATDVSKDSLFEPAVIVDRRLLDAAILERCDPFVARDLARLQLGIAASSGHWLALSDEYVWRRICKASCSPVLDELYVRCARCSIKAWLRTWLRSLTLTPQGKERLRAIALQHNNPQLTAYLEPCRAAATADEVLHQLDQLCGVGESFEHPAGFPRAYP